MIDRAQMEDGEVTDLPTIKRFAVLLAIWLTATLGCGSSTRVTTPSDQPAIRDEGGVILLDNSLEPLIERFNSDRDKPRVVVIVSPT